LACLGIYHVIIGVEIVPGAQLGDGLVIMHGSGIVIGAKSRSEAIV
jgi:serine acetyltransferase